LAYPVVPIAAHLPCIAQARWLRSSIGKPAPDIVEAILNGTQPSTLQLSDLERPFPIDWEAQRTAFGFRANSAR
jgi:hypothetical protein